MSSMATHFGALRYCSRISWLLPVAELAAALCSIPP